jgi:hypothetical protein
MPISQVYQQLTGIQPRRAGPDRWRAKATWRDGGGYNVSLRDDWGSWRDFVTCESGGTLALIARIRGGSRADALRWISGFTGIPLDDRRFSPVERAQYADRRRRMEKNLPVAKYWLRSATPLAEELLTELKVGVSTPGRGLRPNSGEIFCAERFAARLRCVDDEQLVEEYEWFLRRDPLLTGAMIQVAKIRERAERRTIRRCLREANR